MNEYLLLGNMNEHVTFKEKLIIRKKTRKEIKVKVIVYYLRLVSYLVGNNTMNE